MGPADPSGAGIAEPRGGGPGGAGALLGRDRELDTLLVALAAARDGRGGLVLIGGEPGIGKTRLADEVATHAHDQGVTVLWGKCWEAGGAPAYWPWVQALRSYTTDRRVALRDEIGSGAQDIVAVLPELEDVFADLRPRMPTDPESARFHLFDATAGFLRRAARTDPLLVLLEDLQAADTASLLLLRFLAGQVIDMPVLVVATYRDVELTPSHPLTSSITDLVREASTRHILLGGLSRGDVGLLFERTAGVGADQPLVSALHRQTNGNPLFVTEAIRMLATEGGFSGSQESSTRRFAIPEAVREVILRRLGHLSDTTRGLLTMGSVLGHDISFEALRNVLDGVADDVEEGIDEAVGAGLLVEVGGGSGRFRFSHDLVREALYETIPPGRRARLHVLAGEALERMHTLDLEPHLAVIAHHFIEGAPMGDAARASAFARRAAGHAALQLAYEDAVRLYRMALHATELQDDADPRMRCELLLGLGDAQMRAGDAPGARETFLGAAGIARRLGLAEQAAQAALGYGGRFVWARAANDRHLIPLLNDALAAVGEEDSEVRALLLARLAGALRDDLDPGPREAHSREAVSLARRLGDPATLAYALDGRFAAIWAPDTDHEREQIADEIISLAEQIGDPERVFQGRHYRLSVLLERGDIGKVSAELPLNLQLAEELRQPAHLWYAESLAAILALLEGRFDDAERLSTSALDHGRQAEGIHSLGVWLLQTYYLRAALGRAAELESLIRESIDEYAWWPWMRCALVHLYSEVGRTAEARSLFESIAARDFADLPWDNDWLMGITLVAEVAVRLRDTGRAATLYALIAPYADRNGFGHPQFCTGSLERTLGLLAGAMGRVDDAERHLSASIVANERMGARPWAARARHDLARLLTEWDRPGDRAKAAALDRDALTIAEELGMGSLVAALERHDTEETPAHAAEASGRRSIFRREGEYWSIVFEGQSVRVHDSKGMRYLAALLGGPGREHHALELVGMDAGPTARAPSELHTDGWDDAGAILDPQAKRAYRERLDELQADLTEAEDWNDADRAERARAEIEALTRALAEAVGLGGRDRRAASGSERARLNVTRAVRSAMARIQESHPSLGRHLDATIRTGIYCTYTPDPRYPAGWEL